LLTIDLHFSEARSLKDRRRILKSLLARLGNRYNVSVAESGESEMWQRAEIGVAVISNSTPHVHEMLSEVMRFVESQPAVTVISSHMEVM
jgi:uncharacterized protein YlxP (DUF503 family)